MALYAHYDTQVQRTSEFITEIYKYIETKQKHTSKTWNAIQISQKHEC